MKKLLSLLLIICSIGVAYADDKSTVTSLKYVDDQLNTRQDKFGANDGKAMTFTNVAGGNAPRDVKSSLGSNTSDTGLPTVSAVNAGLENKQDEIGAANTNTVVTYTGVAGTLGQKGIYQDTGTYASQQDNLIDAGTFNAALKNGLDNEFVCAGYATTGECWLWSIRNDAPNRSPNLFDISKVPNSGNSILNNGDGTLTIKTPAGTSGVCTASPFFLSRIAPDLEVGKTYTLSFKTTGTTKHIYLDKEARSWYHGVSKNITQDMLDSHVCFYASGVNTTATISEIQIEEGTTATPYVPYGSNIYIPQNQSAQNQ